MGARVGDDAKDRSVTPVMAASPRAPANCALLGSSPPGALMASRRIVVPEEAEACRRVEEVAAGAYGTGNCFATMTNTTQHDMGK